MQGDPTTVTDASGRVIITTKDDRDTPFGFQSPNAISINGLAAFSEVFRFELTRARRGHVLLSANVATDGSFANQYVYIEVNVLAYVGATPAVVMRTGLDQNLPQVKWTWDVPDTYSQIGIEARMIVDGKAPTGAVVGVDSLTLAAIGTYWR